MPEEALVAEVTLAETPVESLMRLTAAAIAEDLVPEINERTCTPPLPAISSVTDFVTADAWKRSAAVCADCTTLTTTGMVAEVPKAALLMWTSCSAEVVTPLVMYPSEPLR